MIILREEWKERKEKDGGKERGGSEGERKIKRSPFRVP